MTCEVPGCGKSFDSRGQHNRYNHPELSGVPANAPRGRPPGVKHPTDWCVLCGRGYGSIKSLDFHGYSVHKAEGYTRADWASKNPARPFNDPLPQALTQPAPTESAEQTVTVSHAPGVPMDIAPTEPGGFKQRHYPPRDDRGNAEKLVDLPWITWPATEAACEDALNQIAKALEHANESLPFWSSFRAYVAALRKRLGQRPEGPPTQQMHAHTSPKQALKAKQVA